jgi:hypothetical protein
MRRAIAAATGLLLLVLAAQAAIAQYTPTGSLTLSTDHPAPGAIVTVSGTGFAIDSNVYVTLESQPLLLATVTANASGDFAVDVTIPASYSGQHTLAATGTDPQGSERVLTSTIQVGAASSPKNAPAQSSDAFVLAIAAAGIVLLTGAIILVMRRASQYAS